MQPELLWVPAHASWEEIAARLFEEPPEVGAFDVEPSAVPLAAGGLPRVAVRVRNPGRLRSEVLEAMRGALEAQWKVDVGWTLERLRGESFGREDKQALAELGLRWSQRSGILDVGGESYFDRYLAPLAMASTDWSFLGEESEKLWKAVALRSKRWKTRYTVTDASPRLAPGDVIGRCYFTSGGASTRTSVHVHVVKPLHAESSMERAEMKARNVPWSGTRAVIPGPDGRFYGYGVSLTNLGEDNPLEGPASRCYWYYPGTVFIREGEWRPGLLASSGSPYLTKLRQSILSEALAAATAAQPEPLLGLDYDVLALFTSEQRARVLNTLLASPALTAGSAERERVVELLVRVVLSTPAEEFPPLENMLSSSETLRKLLAGGAPGLLALGEAFTLKALASPLLSFDSLDSMPAFHLGREGSTTHLLDVLTEEARAGSTKHAALRFRPVRQKFELRYSSSSERDQPSRPLRPVELVRVEFHGPQPQARIMTAAELGMRASVPDTALIWAAVGRISEMHILYSGVSGLARAPLATAASAATAEGGGALAARQVAVRALVCRTALVASMAVVDTYRDELSRTQAGRNFLAVHDFAMLALAARDIHSLATSGLLREWGQRAGTLLSEMGGRTSAGLRESVESARALAKDSRADARRGQGRRHPGGAEVSSARRCGGIQADLLRHAGGDGRRARHRRHPGRGPESSAGRASPGDAETTGGGKPRTWGAPTTPWRGARRLSRQTRPKHTSPKVDRLLASASPTARPAVAELLRASGGRAAKDSVAFLKDAQWLVQHPWLDGEALGALTQKVSKGKVDLRWLRSTALTEDDFAFLARDKNTPWELFKKAAAEPGNWKTQRQARRRLRGIAGEMVTERASQKLFPAYRLKGRQVAMGGEEGSVIDFELVAADGSVRRGVEVKGWTSQTWRQALKAWKASKKAASLDAEQGKLTQQLENVSKQLKNAARRPRGEPFLMVSDKLSKESRNTLEAFIDENARGTQNRTAERGGDVGGSQTPARCVQAAGATTPGCGGHAMSLDPPWAVLAPGDPAWIEKRARVALRLGEEEDEEDELDEVEFTMVRGSGRYHAIIGTPGSVGDEETIAELLSRECAEPVYSIMGSEEPAEDASFPSLVYSYQRGVRKELDVDPQELARFSTAHSRSLHPSNWIHR